MTTSHVKYILAGETRSNVPAVLLYSILVMQACFLNCNPFAVIVPARKLFYTMRGQQTSFLSKRGGNSESCQIPVDDVSEGAFVPHNIAKKISPREKRYHIVIVQV